MDQGSQEIQTILDLDPMFRWSVVRQRPGKPRLTEKEGTATTTTSTS